jgi:hypothetical protein
VKYALALALAAGLASGCAIPASHKAEFQIENKTPQPVLVKASMGPYARQLILAPNRVWNGWVYAPLLVQGKVVIEITPLTIPR